MYENKYNKLLTIGLIIVILAIIGLLVYCGYRYIKTEKLSADAESYVKSYKDEVDDLVIDGDYTGNGNNTNTNTENSTNINDILNGINGINTNTNTNTNTNNTKKPKKETFQGYTVIGTIEIPKTDIEYPILQEYTKTSIEIAVSKMYGANPNEVGNMVLSSHNYRNGKLFSNNKKLSVGDVIYITDMYKNRVKYTIYKKYETTPEDTEYMKRDTAGAREISLTTCTDDSSARIIIWAKAE